VNNGKGEIPGEHRAVNLNNQVGGPSIGYHNEPPLLEVGILLELVLQRVFRKEVIPRYHHHGSGLLDNRSRVGLYGL
jgi:hypothetical protein